MFSAWEELTAAKAHIQTVSLLCFSLIQDTEVETASGLKTIVPKDFLNEAEWAAVPKKVRRCGVTNDMRSDTLLHANESSMFSEHVLNAIHRKSSP